MVEEGEGRAVVLFVHNVCSPPVGHCAAVVSAGLSHGVCYAQGAAGKANAKLTAELRVRGRFCQLSDAKNALL
jgi:hypothetical protein